MAKNKHNILFIPFLFIWILLCFFSFSQRDLNLTIYNFFLFNQIQNWLINLGYFQRPLATIIFLILAFGLISFYWLIVVKADKFNFPKIWPILLIIIGAGLLAYPMFSHDIFNYLFNAKMVLVYGQNPHIHTALEFPKDEWTRFMHNTHTPAPYGYGWTAVSLLPVFLSFGKFTLAFWLTKALVIGFWGLEIYLFYLIARKKYQKSEIWTRVLLLALNPLILMETLIMGHNDSVMMAPVLLAIYLLLFKNNLKNKISSFLLWTFSVSVKYATVVLAPFLIFIKKIDIFTWGGLALLLVLLTRPGQLHSWYLHWGMVLLFLSPKKWALKMAILLTIGGLLRYTPFVCYGNWDPPVPLFRYIILSVPLLGMLVRKWQITK